MSDFETGIIAAFSIQVRVALDNFRFFFVRRFSAIGNRRDFEGLDC
jgi:hypothetical protein